MIDPYPGPARIMESLERLRALDARLAGQRHALDESTRQRENLTRRRAAQAAESLRSQLDAELARLGEARQAAVTAAEARALARANRIRQAQRTARKAAAERVEAEEGRRKFEVQRDMLRSTREHDAGRTAADAVLSATTTTLDATRRELLTLEHEAHGLLGVYGRSILRQLGNVPEPSEEERSLPEDRLLADLSAAVAATRRELTAFRRLVLPRLSRGWPVGLILVLSPLLIIPVLLHFRIASPSPRDLGLLAGAATVVGLLLHFLGRRLATPALTRLLTDFARARTHERSARLASVLAHREVCAHLDQAHAQTTDRCNATWAELQEWLTAHRHALPNQVDQRATRALARNDHLARRTRERLEASHAARTADIQTAARGQLQAVEVEAQRAREVLDGDRLGALSDLAGESTREARPLLESLETFHRGAAGHGFSPDPVPAESWVPPSRFNPRVRFGHLETDLPGQLRALAAATSASASGLLIPPAASEFLESSVASEPPLPAPRPSAPLAAHTESPTRQAPAGSVTVGAKPATRPWSEHWSLPLLLEYPTAGSLLLEAEGDHRAVAISTLNQVICRLLADSPPGRVAFTLYDPVGLGQSFAALTHLADEAGHVINGRVWTQSGQLE